MKNFVERLTVRENQSIRVDCPACGGSKTLGVSKSFGQLKWQCFRASCDVKGVSDYARSAKDLKAAITAKRESIQAFQIPDYWTSPLSDDRSYRYLQQMHCLAAYGKGRADIRFDPKQARVVFLVRYKGMVVNAVGRSLQKEAKPKWYVYGQQTYPYICGDSKTALLVEDAASATAVSGVYTGVALLGTSFQTGHLEALKDFQKLYVMLDRDASQKSIALQNVLRYHIKASVRFIDQDLKYLTENQIRKIVEQQD